MRNKRLLPVLLLAGLASACGDRPEQFESWVGPQGPYIVSNQVVYLDGNWDELVVLSVDKKDPTPAVDRIPLAAGATVIGTLTSAESLLMRVPGTGTILLVKPSDGKVTEYDLETPFDRFLIRQDPPMLAAWFSENAQAGDSAVLFSKGDVAFIDLTKAKDAVTRFTLPTYGGAPLGVEVADVVPAPSGGRQFAFVRWNSFLSLVDVKNPKVPPTAIPLKAPDSDSQVIPYPLQFVAGTGHLTALFLAQASPDLYVLDIDVEAAEGKGAGVSLNVFPTAQGASLFRTFMDADNALTVLVLCPGTRTVAIVRPETSDVLLYPIDFTAQDVNIFRMPGEDGKEEQFAFLFNSGGDSYSYYFVELDRLAEKKSKAFHLFNLPAPVRRVYMVDKDRFLVMHSGGPSPMSMVTVSSGEVISLGGIPNLFSEVFDLSGTILYALSQSGRLVRFNVTDFSAASIDIKHVVTPGTLRLVDDKGLLFAWDANGIVVAPDDFKVAADAVEIALPVLFGLDR
ncbi:MAG: hypothetical protein FJ109_06995 [Deltaproteobacteria bacterium]|nr:hypothetical protein [Deltaproteobacteria bacterium]